MNFEDLLAKLPSLSTAERQCLIQRALDLDDLVFSAEEEALVQERLVEHWRNPGSALSLDEMKTRLRGVLAQ